MADRMPTSVELDSAFGGKGVVGQTRTVFQALRDEEQQGRLMRDAQVQDNCTFQWSQVAVFDEGAAGGQLLTDWIDFGTLRFTKKPVFTCGSEWMRQEGEPTLDPNQTNFDPTQYLLIPGGAEVFAWRTDERGYFKSAKLVLYAYGAVPVGYRVTINGVWTGPAVRKA